MDPIRVPIISSSDANLVRRAFSCGKRADSSDGIGIELVDGVVTAHRNAEQRLIDPSRVYAHPESPTISEDGTQAALVYDSQLSNERVVELISTAPENWKSVRCLSTMGLPGSVAAADLAPDGCKIAMVSKAGDIRVSPTYGHLDGSEYNTRLVDSLGARQGANDVEFLPGGRLAIETSYGTYLLMDLEGKTSCLPMRSFDSEGWAARCREAEQRLSALTRDEREAVLDEFGNAAVAAHASPDGRLVLVQVRREDEHVENLIMERKTGRRVSMGLSAEEPPLWKETTISLPHGSSARYSTLFPFSGFDEDDAATTRPTVVQFDAIIVNGIRVPRNLATPRA